MVSFYSCYTENCRDGRTPPYSENHPVLRQLGGHDRTLIGAGRERRCSWIDLVCNDSDGFENYYAAAEELIKNICARPHLDKYCENIDSQDLKRLHGEHFERFRQLVAQHDPEGKFANDFTRRLFSPGVERNDAKGVERAA